MNRINIEHIRKQYGEKLIFEDASFGIQSGDKVGIVGRNGSGKSTLLKIVAGKEAPDQGQVILQNGLKMTYVPQNPVFPENATVQSFAFCSEEVERWRVESNLTELGITDFNAPMSQLSGGQKRRVVLAKMLAEDVDVLLLDEPTNHLDENMIGWLEEYLRAYRGTLLMVTHDRYFLDRVANRILEISHGSLYGYDSDYTGFLELKAAREEMELASQRKRQSILRMEMEWARRGCRARSTKQKARLERLEQLKNASDPVADQDVELGSVETRLGKKTIELHQVSKSFGEKTILQDFTYVVLKNQRLGIVGPNGCGKSTLLRLMAGEVLPDQGRVERGETVKIGYFAQEEQEMDDRERVIDYVKNIAEYVTTKEGKISASRLLERFLFPADLQYAPIGKLSGGEKRRLYLLGVLAENANVLLFDEPGNNLDIPTLTLLEDYLQSFTGIVVTVSHDRYFLDNVADRIFELDGKGNVTQYEGGYTDYLEAKKRKGRVQPESDPKPKSTPAQRGKPERTRPTKLRFSYREQREFDSIDAEIERLEEKKAGIERQIQANATNSVKLKELFEENEKTEKELEEKMERWIYLNDLAERISQQN